MPWVLYPQKLDFYHVCVCVYIYIYFQKWLATVYLEFKVEFSKQFTDYKKFRPAWAKFSFFRFFYRKRFF